MSSVACRREGGIRFISSLKDMWWASLPIGELETIFPDMAQDRHSARLEAQASLSGYPNSANRGYQTEGECIEAWQGMCVLGIHPHPVDPAFMKPPTARAAAFVNTSPRKSSRASSSTGRGPAEQSPMKREGTPGRAPADAQLLADLYIGIFLCRYMLI
jgi:hypothetical protein